MKSELTAERAENNQLKQALNLINYCVDSLEQYGQQENLRIHNVPESLTMETRAKLKLLRSQMLSILA